MTLEMNDSVIKKQSQDFCLENIFNLDLRARNLLDFGSATKCINIIYLDISNNKISSLSPIKDLVKLQYLIAVNNKLSNVAGIESLELLDTLNIAGNLIKSVDALVYLSELKSLRNFRLSDKALNLTNPLYHSHSNNIRQKILHLLPGLKLLDGEVINGEGKEFFDLCSTIDCTLAKASNTTLGTSDLDKLEMCDWPNLSSLQLEERFIPDKLFKRDLVNSGHDLLDIAITNLRENLERDVSRHSVGLEQSVEDCDLYMKQCDNT